MVKPIEPMNVLYNTSADIDRIGWTSEIVAQKLGLPSGTVRSWKHRDTFPLPVRVWLRKLAEMIEAVGVPKL